jgi:hypothetical protein
MSGPSNADPAVPLAPAAADAFPGLSRRRVLRGAAGAGAAGLAVAAGGLAAAPTPALAETARPAVPSVPAAATAAGIDAAEPVVVHLRDARSGEMDVFAGTRHTRVHDPDLAARLARAAR